MPISLTRHVGNATAAKADELSVSPSGTSVPVGAVLVVRVWMSGDGHACTIADNSAESGDANSYTQIHSGTTTSGGGTNILFACLVTREIQTTDTITMTSTTGKTGCLVGVEEFDGLTATENGTSGSQAQASTTTPSTPSRSYSANVAVFGHICSGGTQSITTEDLDTDGGASWVPLTVVYSGRSFASYKIPTSAATHTFNLVTDSGNYMAAIMALDAAAPAAPFPPWKRRYEHRRRVAA